MDPVMNEWMQLLFRWVHIVAGVLWIGHLYFFNFVNANFAKTMDAATKKGVVPELMPRALYMFRWGAAWTWISGMLLLGLVYYHGGTLWEDPAQKNVGLALGLLVAVIAICYLYDVIVKMVKDLILAPVICLAILAGIYWILDNVGNFSGRALYIHVGTLLGTVMAMNVWMRIWPAQRRIIGATKDGSGPNPDDVALAGLRSRHNTYMSVPLLFTMISNHYPALYGSRLAMVYLAIIFAIGFAVTRWIYAKAAKVSGM